MHLGDAGAVLEVRAMNRVVLLLVSAYVILFAISFFVRRREGRKTVRLQQARRYLDRHGYRPISHFKGRVDAKG